MSKEFLAFPPPAGNGRDAGWGERAGGVLTVYEALCLWLAEQNITVVAAPVDRGRNRKKALS